MNEDIEKFLDGYLVNSDPQYAVFLKGFCRFLYYLFAQRFAIALYPFHNCSV